jgi:hypothetical protein
MSGNWSSRAIIAMLPLIWDLEDKVEEVKKENQNIREQLIELENSVNLLKKQKAATDRPSKKSP